MDRKCVVKRRQSSYRPAPADRRALAAALAPFLLQAVGCTKRDRPEEPSITTHAPDPVIEDAPATPASVEVTQNGLTISFELAFEEDEKSGSGAPRMARAVLGLKDAATGMPATGLGPRVWLSERKEGAAALDPDACRKLVASFAGGFLSARPAAVLDGYLVLSLNDDPTLSIIDPRVALSRTKLQSLVALPGQAADWAAAPEGASVFVTIPERDVVTEVDVLRGRARGSVEVGDRPTRIVARGKGRSFWVANDGDGTVSVLDRDAPEKRQTLAGGEGHQEIVFVAGGERAWVSASGSESLRVFDAERGALLADVNVGKGVVAVAGSDEASMILAAREDGELVIVDEAGRTVTTRIPMGRGASSIAFAPPGRFAWIVQKDAGAAHVFDASQGKIVRTTNGLSRPDHVVFTRHYAYVRELGSSHLSMFGLAGIEKNESPKLVQVAMGQAAPGAIDAPTFAAPMAPLPEGGGMIVAHPVDRNLYGYVEGMMAPVATHPAYGRSPRAVRLVDRSLRETEPGVYEAPLRLDRGGILDVAVQLESPRKITACLESSLPEAEPRLREEPFELEPLFDPGERLVAGRPATLRFRLREPVQARALTVLFARDPAGYAWRGVPRDEGEGVYSVNVNPSLPGPYRLVVRLSGGDDSLGRRASLRLGVRAREGGT
ncbi:hypothetical protein [Polyangium sp. y55x31]|uniref:YncE family protein n=1 Tax=Polyangium sp. y55x31 TaxID=3042688 RepID=UPI002482CBEA|nr:hypothetical protein [Polyangium sp. y55x31]MDI1479601.1 hypothetical protein [Polyangium sp. y55x31]